MQPAAADTSKTRRESQGAEFVAACAELAEGRLDFERCFAA
jgi:hypothetical protein